MKGFARWGAPARRAGLAALLAGALLGAPSFARAGDEPEAPAAPEAPEAAPIDADELRDVPEPSPASAEMLKSMREKGILSKEEYEDIYRRQAVYEYEEREREKAPAWAQGWTVGGDLRIRLERVDRGDLHLAGVIAPVGTGLPDFLEEGDDAVDFLNNVALGRRDRMRLRFRIGAERLLGENWTVGFRIATAQALNLTTDYGSDLTGVDLSKSVIDYRSSNVDAADYFAPKGIYLDRAYLQFNPEIAPALKVVAGKFENMFRAKYFNDVVVFDDDINPEGVALQYRFDFLPETWWFEGNLGYLIIEEIGAVDITEVSPGVATTTLPDPDDRDPFILAYQASTHVQPAEWLRFGVRGSYYDYHNLSIRDAAILSDLGNGGDAIDQNPLFSELPVCPRGSESCYFQRRRAAGRIQQSVVDLYLRIAPTENWPVTPFLQYTTLSNTTEDDGFSVGIEIGRPELLQLRAMWATVERNSTVALFTDSDLFDGVTNAKGWNVSIARKLSPNVTLRLSYYSARVKQDQCVAVVNKDLPALFCDSASVETLAELYSFKKAGLDHRKRIQIDLTAEF